MRKTEQVLLLACRRASWAMPVAHLALACALPAEPPRPIALELPVEVLGAPGVEVSMVFELDASAYAAASGGATLALTIHNVVETESATMSLNDGAPIDLGGSELPFRRGRGEVTRGEIALAASDLREGANVLTFRYTRQVPNVSGFRILAAELAAGTAEVPLALDREPPAVLLSRDEAAIERGGRFFREVSRDGGPVCSRCHTPNGEDLTYFRFSSHSIVERAMFHEFSREEATDIASFLASLDVPALGTVFDPPFQPGEGAVGSAGAGLDAVISSEELASLVPEARLDTAPAWDWAASIDTYALPATIQFPTWFRWLPRAIDPNWFTMHDGELAIAEAALLAEPTLENAQRFEAVAVALGKEIMVRDRDHEARVELLRFAAVRLWNWSRLQGFDDPDHGLPDGTPAYPYEIGFAFFEALVEGGALPESAAQTMQWWWLQLALDPGRGLSNGRRPLNYEDVQSAADRAGLGLAERGFLHLLGSFEESRGTMATELGTALGPVRLLEVPMLTMPPAQRESVLERFFAEQSAHLARGGTLDADHHARLAAAWSLGCEGLDPAVVSALRARAPVEVATDLTACPP
jgi:hypothetical protein